MKSSAIRKKSEADLKKTIGQLRDSLRQLKFDLPGGKVKNVKQARETRKDIARILTILREKQGSTKAKQ